MIPQIFSSRKAQISMGIKPIIGSIIALMVILATVGLFIGLMNIFSPKADEGTVSGFSQISEGVEALYNPKNTDTLSCSILNLYGQPDWAVAGFNADGTTSLTEGEKCKRGGFCIEEHCGLVEDDVDKPLKCGSGACLCLCDGGGMGDVDGDDCDEGNARCYKFKAPELEQFVYASADQKVFADLVVYSESCWGTDRKVRAGVVLSKDGKKLTVFEFSKPEEIKNRFATTIPCRDLARKLKQASQKPIEVVSGPAAAPSGPTVDQTLANRGAGNTPTAAPI
jgi:hypothetical protein